MAYTLSNKCAKNCHKRTILVQVIIEDVITFFWNSVVYANLYEHRHFTARNSLSGILLQQWYSQFIILQCIKLVSLLLALRYPLSTYIHRTFLWLAEWSETVPNNLQDQNTDSDSFKHSIVSEKTVHLINYRRYDNARQLTY